MPLLALIEKEVSMNVNIFRLISDRLSFRVCRAVLVGFISFILVSLLFFSIYNIALYGFSLETFKAAGFGDLRLRNVFNFVFSLYGDWWHFLNDRTASNKFSYMMLMPFFSILISLSLLVWFVFHEVFVYSNKYFASLRDILELDIFGDAPMVFGKKNGIRLKPKSATSTLVWFGERLGKTASIAVPTMFESDKSNIIAVDSTGTLAKLTSGYRRGFTKVFNFDWEKLDNEDSGEIYLRWNPISMKMIPDDEEEKIEYIKDIAQYIIIKDIDDYWEKIAAMTLEALLHFFVSKISHAMANDYFLREMREKRKLEYKDAEILFSYYKLMDSKLAKEAMRNLDNGSLNLDNYVPIGSWYGIPKAWRGKDLSFAMFVDTLLVQYSEALKEDVEQIVWKEMLEDFSEEVAFFGYLQKYVHVFEHMIHLSKKQRKVVFSIIIEALSPFRKKTIRERTSLCDFDPNYLRGIFNPRKEKNSLVTVYVSAYTEASLFLTGMFVNALLSKKNLSKNTETPLLFVIDDFESLPKFKNLNEAMTDAKQNNLSFMLLTNSVLALQKIYDKNSLENIINKTEYKLLSSNNNVEISNKLKVISDYLQENRKVSVIDKLWSQKSQTYSKISRDILSPSLAKYISRGKYLLLADSFYGRPISLGSLYFIKESDMKEKALIEETIYIEPRLLEKRHPMDIEVPDMLDVMRFAGSEITSEEELDKCIFVRKEALVENISKIKDSRFDERLISDKFDEVRVAAKRKKDVEDYEDSEDW